MAHYKVSLNENASYEVIVEASSPEDAEQKAEEKFTAEGVAKFPCEVHDREVSNVEEIDAADIGETSAPAPAGWTHAETSAPDDPTQEGERGEDGPSTPHAETSTPNDPTQQCAHHRVTVPGQYVCIACGQKFKVPAGEPTPATQAVESFITESQQDLPLPELLAAILRRAERARSYGRLMLSSKDSCIDDVVRLATRALLQVNDQRSA